MPRFILSRAASAGIDPIRLARAAGMPSWLLADTEARVPSEYFLRLWELLEREAGDPDTTLRVVAGYRVGEFGLVDYLVSTADTLGAGLAVAGPYVGTATTNYRFEAGAVTDAEAAFELYTINGEGRGRELGAQAVLGVLIARIRQMTGRPIDPLRVAFRQPAPRTRHGFADFFGTARIDFGAPVDEIAFRPDDFELPQVTADPMLARVLLRHAANMPPPPPRTTEWPDRVADVLAVLQDRDSEPALDQAARRLFTSPRTLQRRLAESGTTWRLEVDRARKRHLELLDAEPGRLPRGVDHVDVG
ncbi:AraC family transcriptional regulator ligand-binding domain-containing protein [Nocardia sp. NPDC088792]|uniref:AraC family transcriptional regulator ligand-binding domain-containing protein n=1 Tax=Nocardia sp. NPDC088792 TaxID=3364332 RepID=UPI003823FB1A